MRGEARPCERTSSCHLHTILIGILLSRPTNFPSIASSKIASQTAIRIPKETIRMHCVQQFLTFCPTNPGYSAPNLSITFSTNSMTAHSLSKGKSFHLPGGFVLLSIAGLVILICLCIPLIQTVGFSDMDMVRRKANRTTQKRRIRQYYMRCRNGKRRSSSLAQSVEEEGIQSGLTDIGRHSW